jgi:hypothetical protein
MSIFEESDGIHDLRIFDLLQILRDGNGRGDSVH